MQNYTDEIIAKFPNLTCSVLNGGVNVYYHKYVITIWWKKQTYCDTKKHKWARFTSLEAIIQVIEAASVPKAKKVAPIAPNPPKTPIMDYVNDSKTGIDLAMMHIQKKIDYGQANNLSPSNVAMLNNLLNELKQFL